MRNEAQLVVEHSINASRGNLPNLAAKTGRSGPNFLSKKKVVKVTSDFWTLEVCVLRPPTRKLRKSSHFLVSGDGVAASTSTITRNFWPA